MNKGHLQKIMTIYLNNYLLTKKNSFLTSQKIIISQKQKYHKKIYNVTKSKSSQLTNIQQAVSQPLWLVNPLRQWRVSAPFPLPLITHPLRVVAKGGVHEGVELPHVTPLRRFGRLLQGS